jgi:hypothetical protein
LTVGYSRHSLGLVGCRRSHLLRWYINLQCLFPLYHKMYGTGVGAVHQNSEPNFTIRIFVRHCVGAVHEPLLSAHPIRGKIPKAIDTTASVSTATNNKKHDDRRRGVPPVSWHPHKERKQRVNLPSLAKGGEGEQRRWEGEQKSMHRASSQPATNTKEPSPHCKAGGGRRQELAAGGSSLPDCKPASRDPSFRRTAEGGRRPGRNKRRGFLCALRRPARSWIFCPFARVATTMRAETCVGCRGSTAWSSRFPSCGC